ncbi:MAG: glycosyltransferase family 2 protein, partial [Lentisphaerae bacterium]|nr:glycosyltransferase family 2 protein [Lentisphaerota bacterium]
MNSFAGLITKMKLFFQIGAYFKKKLSSMSDSFHQMSAPLFTVVLPVFGRTTELREAIESVLVQSFQSYELFIVCDGSPEETLDVVMGYVENPRVRIRVYDDNSGNACRGRNTAISEARGKYIAFLDSDDIAMPDRLSDTLSVFRETCADVVYGAGRFIVDGSRKLPGITDGHILIPEPFDFEKAKVSNPILTCTASIRTACLNKYGSFRQELKYREDHELWLRLAYYGCKFVATDKLLSAYRLHAGNAELSFIQNDDFWRSEMLRMYT